MKVIELVERIKNEKPELFAEVPEKQAAILIREVFRQIGKNIEQLIAQDDILRIRGLGSFRIRMVEKEKKGRTISEKRILFRPAKTPSGKVEE